MLKVLAAVLAVLSAAISITIYTTTLPEVQKQAADNAKAIEQIQSGGGGGGGGGGKLYKHAISFVDNSNTYTYRIISTSNKNCSGSIGDSAENYYEVFEKSINNVDFDGSSPLFMYAVNTKYTVTNFGFYNGTILQQKEFYLINQVTNLFSIAITDVVSEL